MPQRFSGSPGFGAEFGKTTMQVDKFDWIANRARGLAEDPQSAHAVANLMRGVSKAELQRESFETPSGRDTLTELLRASEFSGDRLERTSAFPIEVALGNAERRYRAGMGLALQVAALDDLPLPQRQVAERSFDQTLDASCSNRWIRSRVELCRRQDVLAQAIRVTEVRDNISNGGKPLANLFQ